MKEERLDSRNETCLPTSPEATWRVLLDFDAYPRWISTLRLSGEPIPGHELEYAFRGPGGRMLTLFARVEHCVPAARLSLTGGVPGLIRFRETFILTPAAKGTLLVHEAGASGLLAALLGRRRLQRNLQRFTASFDRCLLDYITKITTTRKSTSAAHAKR
jgi:hypothetical protein